MNTRICFGAVAQTVIAFALAGYGEVATAHDAATTVESTPDGAGTNAAQPDAASTGLTDIIVTARKIRERLQDAPVSVTTVSGSTLQIRGIRDISEVTKLASSLKFDSDADVRAGVAIRGVGQSADVNAAPGVGLFIDGVYQPSSAYYTVPFFDVDRIEILKGPQGTLYGKNTMGGAISIVSREPTPQWGGNASVEGSSGSTVVASGAINVPLVGDTLGNRTSVFYRYSDGLQTDKTTHVGADQRRDFAIRSRFVLKSGTKFKSSLSVFYADLQSTPFPYSTSNPGATTDLTLNNPVDNVTKDYNGLIISKYKSVNFGNTLDLGAATLTSLTSYDNAHVTTNADADFTYAPGLLVGGVLNRDTFAQELRLSNAAAASHFHWLVGGYYNNDKTRSTNLTSLPALGNFPLTTGATRETGTTYAGFGQATLVLGKLELVAGVRYDDETRHNVSTELNNQYELAGGPPVNSLFDAIVVSKAWQPKASISYHFAPDVMAYASVARGFRAGGFNAITAPAAFASYKPEKTTNYEGGLKTELFHRHVRLNGDVFYTNYDDILQTNIVRGTDGSQTVVSINGGKARSFGAELDAAWQVSSELTLTGGYTYLNIKDAVIPVGNIRREVSGFAPHNFNVQADYIHPINGDLSIGAHASVAYVGKTPLGTVVEWRDAHAVTDASLDFNYHRATLSLFGKNIFNERYYLSFIPAAFTALQITSLGLLNRPAEYGVRLSLKY